MDGTHILSGTAAAQTHKPIDDRTRQRLQHVTKEFESLLVGYMLKSMRSSMNSSEIFGDSYGGDVLEGLFDGQMAQHVSRNSSLGLAELLYRRMTGEELPTGKQPPARPGAAAALPPQPQDNVLVSAAASATVPVPAEAPRQAGIASPALVLSQKDRPAGSTASPDSARAVPDTLRRRLDLVAPLIQEAADTHRVDPNLLKAVIAAESRGNPQARSPKNAKGLMQLIDSTATAMGVKNVWNPRENVLGGAKYLSTLMEQFGGDREKAVASYNAGPGAVQRHGGIPPFKETQAYVEKVMKYMKLFEQQESGNDNGD
jgi:soluble lytic murein transglycosylase-like protein